MPVLIEIAWLVARMVVMRTGLFRNRFVAVTVVVQIAGGVTGMIVMWAGLFFGHECFLQFRRSATGSL